MRNLLLSLAMLGAAFALGPAIADAQAPTPTPIAPPAAPSNLAIGGGVLTWTDNSDNEDGFRIVIRVIGDAKDDVTELRFEVGANETSFVVPPEASMRCPDRTARAVAVSAFNGAGESEAARIAVVITCLATPWPTETPEAAPTETPEAGPTVLPVTGGGAGGRGGTGSLLWTLAAAGAALGLLGAGAGWRAIKAGS